VTATTWVGAYATASVVAPPVVAPLVMIAAPDAIHACALISTRARTWRIASANSRALWNRPLGSLLNAWNTICSSSGSSPVAPASTNPRGISDRTLCMMAECVSPENAR
jgi:hypothetical protein